MATEFNAGSFLGRWIFALALVLGTYNPTRWCYFSWVTAETTEFGPVVAIVGIALLIGWIIFLRATFMSMGWLGIVLEGALFGLRGVADGRPGLAQPGFRGNHGLGGDGHTLADSGRRHVLVAHQAAPFRTIRRR